MKKLLLLLFLTVNLSCSKAKHCPDYASNGCGCYNTGSGQNPYAVTSWDPTTQTCNWTDALGNDHPIDKKYCPCR